MSDPTPGGADKAEVPEPGRPDVPEVPDAADRPEVPATPDAPETPAFSGGDETARIPVEPEVAWNAPEPPRAMPWEAPATGAAAGALVPPVQPATSPDGSPAPTGVLSAATVGWVAPPPEPVATGQPGWVVASTGVRFVAYLIDGFLCALILGFGVGVALAIAPGLSDGGSTVGVAYGVASAGLYFVYFVGFWTSGAQATPGMRLLKLRVANASDGKRLAIGPATVRWLALGYIFTVIAVIPALTGLSLLALIWWIVLLVTTASDGMHQGLHDKWAKSVMVRPQGAGAGSGLVAGCLIVLLIIGFFFVASIVGLILLGSQLSSILSAVGDSI